MFGQRPALGIRYAAIILFTIAAIGTAVWSLRSTRSRERVRMSEPTQIVVSSAPPGNPVELKARAAQMRAVLEPRLVAELGQISSLGASAAKELREDVLSAFSIYLAGSPEEYLSRLHAVGRPVPLSMAGMAGDELAAYWSSLTSSVRGAHFEDAGARARAVYVRGRKVIREPEPRSISYLEPNGRPLDPEAQSLDVYEILMPADMPDLEGKLWPCRLGLWMVRSERSPRWRVWKVVVHDIAGNVRVVLPPPE